jgi:hypothetical protein
MIDKLRQHIDNLIAGLRVNRFHGDDDGFHVYWIDDREEASALTVGDPVELRLPKIETLEDYATCLHEIGHVEGRYQRSEDETVRERWAWRWAREQALVWTAEMEQDVPCLYRLPRT